MIRLILTVILCVLTAMLAVFLTLNPGVVTIDFLGMNAQAPFALALGALLVATFLLVVAWWIIAKLWAAPDAWKRFSLRRRRDQGFDALERALIASAAGQGDLAVRQASRAEALLDRPALSRLLAARAAEAAGDLESAQIHYEAMLADAKTRLVAQRGLVGIAQSRSDSQALLTHAADAFDQAGQARWAFDALFEAQVNAAQWAKAETTLSEGERRGHIERAEAARMRAVLLTAEARRIEATDAELAAKLADRAATASPGFAPAAELAGRLLAAHRRHRRAADVLETAWEHAPHPALARAFANLRRSDTKAKRAERLRELAALNPEHRESRLLLLETALDQGNREAAHAAFKPVLETGPVSARACALAARLAKLDDQDAEAQRWMARASHAPAEADWSDISEDGQAFLYTDADWKRMVDSWGRHAVLIHPRHERYEIAAAAAPETMLIQARPTANDASKRSETEDKAGPNFYVPGPAPDDPGASDRDT
ncbi:heme biosynthesis HemY N-terminal domain-containing protein [Oceanicaulis alexandrii]|uniref:heme biosynthesis protein HemY n=1 Tax=Oceanicaulis alexandrii TaxID=153233 RepID=UPI0035CF5376